MSLEEAIKAEHAKWFGKKCKFKPGEPNFTNYTYTITKVSVETYFNDAGEVYMVYVGNIFFKCEEEQHSRYTRDPEGELEILS